MTGKKTGSAWITYKKEIVEKKKDFKKNVLDRLFSYMRDKNDRLEKMAEEKAEVID